MLEMMNTDLEHLIVTLGLGDHRDALLVLARPALALVDAQERLSPGCSKLGGAPDLSASMLWPEHRLGPYRFIVQIDLRDLPNNDHGLPDRGMLSFFYAHDEDGESFWGDPDYVRVYYFDDVAALEPRKPPPPVDFGSSLRVHVQTSSELPPWPWSHAARNAWPIPEPLRDNYQELRSRLHPSGRYLMGYPDNSTLAYDPTPGPEWCSLLTLCSDDNLEWLWHDGDWLVTFIERQRLREGDFSQIKADAG